MTLAGDDCMAGDRAASLDEEMRRHAEAAVQGAAKAHSAELDYSEQSIETLERLLGEVHSFSGSRVLRLLRWATRQPNSDEVQQIDAVVFGAYLGEVIRRRWGGTWEQTEQGVGLKVNDGVTLFPVNKVLKRIRDGDTEDVRVFYDRAIAHIRAGAEGAPLGTS